MNAVKRSTLKRTLVAVSVDLALCGLAAAQETQAPAQDRKDAAAIETVVVVGSRAALEKSRELKRNAVIVQDSISSEDMGRFPDDNVADALGHITGVTVQRGGNSGIGGNGGIGGGGGEGMGVSLRGLGPDFAMTLFNGRLLATDANTRNFSFDVLPSEVIYGADVLKSAQASQMDGSIGGIVNLRTARPLDKPGMRTALRAEGEYNDLSGNRGHKLGVGFSNTFANNTMGLSIGLLKYKEKRRTDGIDDYYYISLPNYPDTPQNGSSTPTPLIGLENYGIGTMTQAKERSSLSSTLEWKPTSNIRMTADVLVTKLKANQIGNSQSFYFGDYPGPGFLANVTSRNGIVTGFDTTADSEWGDQVFPEVFNRTKNRVVDTTLFGLNGEWKVSDALKLTGDIYQSKAKRHTGGGDTGVSVKLNQPAFVKYQTATDSLPFVTVTLEDGRDLATAVAKGQLNASDWNLATIRLTGDDIDDKISGVSITGVWKLDRGFLDSLNFGATHTGREKTRAVYSNDRINYTNPGSPNNKTYRGGSQYSGVSMGTLGPGLMQLVSPDNFMRGSGGSFPTAMFDFDTNALLSSLKTLDGQPNPKYGGAYNLSNTTTVKFRANQSYIVQEETNALFGELNLTGDNWFGNVGIRAVRNDTTASNATPSLVSFSGSGQDIDFVYSAAIPVTVKSSDNRYLPSANFGYWARRDFLVRVGAAQTMARPTQSALNPVYDVLTSKHILYYGHPALKPVDANQADVSLEWYFAPKSMLTGAVFVKKIKNFITYRNQPGETQYVLNTDTGQMEPFTVERPTNGDKADVRGIEIGLLHMFDNGFGVNATYTKTNSVSWVNGINVGDLDGVAPTASSFRVLYEKGPISAQVSIDHTGAFLDTQHTASGSLKRDNRPMNWVGATFSYEVAKDVRLFAEGKNLADASERVTVEGVREAPFAYSTWGRTYVLGVTAKF